MNSEVAKCIEYKDKAWDIETKISLLIQKFTPATSNGDVHNSSTHSAHSGGKPVSKLPKLTIPKFNGDPLLWQEFWDSFRHAVHENSELSEIEKFQHLKSLLTDEAIVVANGYRLTAVNYNSVVDELVDRFGSEEVAVFAHFDKLLALPISSLDTRKLQNTYDETESHIRSLVNLGLSEETFGQVFTPIILSKLPWVIRTELHRKNGSNRWTLSNLRQLFREELKARKMGEWTLERQPDRQGNKAGSSDGKSGSPGSSKGWSKSKSPPMTGGALSGGAVKGGKREDRPLKCLFCNSTAEERRELAKGLCYRCLRKGHMSKNCEKPPKCHFCGQTTHHSSLCLSQFGSASGNKTGSGFSAGASSGSHGPSGATIMNTSSDLDPNATPFDPNQNSDASSASLPGPSNSSTKPGFVQMQMAVVKFGPNKIPVRFFFDSGCSKSYVTALTSKQLGLKRVGTEVISNGRFEDNQRRTHSYPRVELSIPTSKGTVDLSLLVTGTIACPITRVPIDTKRYPILEQVVLADPPPTRAENVTIDILIGNDQYFTIIEHERIELKGGLMLLASKLGYITSGPVDNTGYSGVTAEATYLSALFGGSTSFQNSDLERFWSLEDMGIKDDSYAKDDELALQKFNSSIRYNGTRYEVGWPWKSENPDLPSNYDLAYGRLKSLTRRLQKDPDLCRVYNQTIQNQLQSEIIESVPDPESKTSRIHYLPHHCIVKPDRATTKVRVVYDGSAKVSSTSNSLNDCLLRGPVFLRDLCGLLLKFRLPQFAVTADIEKAFLQVCLRAADRDVTRFLWLKDVNGPISPSNIAVYRFCRVLFGIISSPFLLDATIKHFLRQSDHPLIKAIADGLYVDNVVSGADSEADCISIYDSTKQIFKENGMNVREWISNSSVFMSHVPECDQSQSFPCKVLGVLWNPENDVLSCAAKIESPANVKTKRHLIQATSKVFDPCGFLAPVIVLGKILVQELWARKIKWDQALPSDVFDRWLIIAQSLESVSEITVPRFIGRLGSPVWNIHCFCDASCKAYTGVVYFQSNLHKPPVLIFSKTKLAPLKSVTMPRLELMAVVVGCRITSFVMKHMFITSATVTVWSDSKCVLQWLQSNKVLSVFVEHRVQEIRSFDFSFRYVPTQMNPADISSRGCTISDLADSSLWWHGPPFLCEAEAAWPPTNLGKEVPPDSGATDHTTLASSANPVVNAVPLLEINRYSSLTHLLRVTVWVLRFISTLLRKVSKQSAYAFPAQTGQITCSELSFAKDLWVSSVQQETLTPTGLQFYAQSNIHQQLGVYIDNKGFYRCSGRVQHSGLPDDAKFPLLLPRNHRFTHLVIMDIHTRNMHASRIQTLALLRERYWVPHGQAQVKYVLHRCLVCRRTEGKPFAVPPFPPLPDYRVRRAKPFLNVGVDYFGPLYIKHGEDTSKVWISLFTCAATRAVHLEVITDLSTDQFLLAFRRFISIHTTPHIIVSDNAKHFKLAKDVLLSLWTKMINSDEIQDFCGTHGIQWIFIPEYSPWMGGFYERLVGTVKRALKKVLGRQLLSLVQLQTVIAEICAVVNTRPLVAPKDDISSVLSPADLLGKSKGFPVKQGKTYDFLTFDAPESAHKSVRFAHTSSETLVEQWKQNRRVVYLFWQIWSSQYLTSLRDMKTNHRNRNTSESEATVGSVVTIKSNLPRSVWSLGKISALNKSADGQVRSATVLLPNKKTVTRPLKLLYPIETNLIDKLENLADQSKDYQIVPPARPDRQAARLAKIKIREQLQDEAVSTTLCCFISGNSPAMPVEQELINNNSPLHHRYSKHAFLLGTQPVTSIQMGAWYLILTCHGREDLAHALVNNAGLRKNANGISAWLEQIEFRKIGDVNCLLMMDRIYYAVVKALLDTPGNKVVNEFRRYREVHQENEFGFVLCSRQEFVFSCGYSASHPTIQDPDTWPGFNVMGDVLDTLFSHWAFQNEVENPTVDQILADPEIFGHRFTHVAKILSDSMSRHLRSVEYSTILRRTGATFARLSYGAHPEEIKSSKYIIILAGSNMTCKSWNESQWETDWCRMLKALRPVLTEDPDNQILINGPIWSTKPRAIKVPEFSSWLQQKVQSIDNITFFDWSYPEDNPFVERLPNGRFRINTSYFDGDRYHVNPRGYMLFWRRWCYTFPDLQLFTTKIDTAIWQPLNRPHVPHSQNRRVTASTAF